MDGTAFDRWTRLFAQRRSRRVVAMAAAGAAVAIVAPRAAGAEDCGNLEQSCATSDQCCEGLYCDGNSECALCSGGAGSCTSDAQCCGGYTTGVCISGFCQACMALTQYCDVDNPCCNDGLYCSADDVCASCKIGGDACSGDVECCAGLVCADDVCAPPCSESGEGCQDDSGCCDGLTCVDGTCEGVADFPNTGSGDGNGGPNLAGAAALPGPAAVAGALLKARHGQTEA